MQVIAAAAAEAATIEEKSFADNDDQEPHGVQVKQSVDAAENNEVSAIDAKTGESRVDEQMFNCDEENEEDEEDDDDGDEEDMEVTADKNLADTLAETVGSAGIGPVNSKPEVSEEGTENKVELVTSISPIANGLTEECSSMQEEGEEKLEVIGSEDKVQEVESKKKLQEEDKELTKKIEEDIEAEIEEEVVEDDDCDDDEEEEEEDEDEDEDGTDDETATVEEAGSAESENVVEEEKMVVEEIKRIPKDKEERCEETKEADGIQDPECKIVAEGLSVKGAVPVSNGVAEEIPPSKEHPTPRNENLSQDIPMKDAVNSSETKLPKTVGSPEFQTPMEIEEQPKDIQEEIIKSLIPPENSEKGILSKNIKLTVRPTSALIDKSTVDDPKAGVSSLENKCRQDSAIKQCLDAGTPHEVPKALSSTSFQIPDTALTDQQRPAKVTNGPGAGKRRIDATERADGSGSSSSSEGEPINVSESKRIRFDESIFEEDERERIIREFVEKSAHSVQDINKNCDKLRQEINALSDLARAKELEWSSIMRLLKLKEEMLERIMFKKRQTDFVSSGKVSSAPEDSLSKLKYSLLAEHYNSSGKGQKNEIIPAGKSLGSAVSITPVPPGTSSSSSTFGPTITHNSSILSSNSVTSSQGGNMSMQQQQHADQYRNASSPMQNSTDTLNSKMRSNRPILPKPSASPVALINPINAAAAAMLMNDQANSVIGEGRQGPILDVKSIIADFRSKNPSDTQPRRGGAGRSRNTLAGNVRAPDVVINQPPRMIGNTSLLSMANMALGSGSHVRTSVASSSASGSQEQQPAMGGTFFVGTGDVSNSMKTEMMRNGSGGMINNGTSLIMQPTSTDTAGTLMLPSNLMAAAASSHQTFQEALAKFAKINSERRDNAPSSTTTCSPLGNSAAAAAAASSMLQQLHHQQLIATNQQNKNAPSQHQQQQHLPPPPPYPEVTLHPVLAPPQSTASTTSVQNSLLHGILTKNSTNHHPGQQHPAAVSASPIQHRPTTFSPTLARLLTAPERGRVANRNNNTTQGVKSSTKSSLTELLNSKTRTEVTITPVTSSAPASVPPASVAPATKPQNDVIQLDEEEEADDRLVIDESRNADASSSDNGSSVIPADQVPECQGCHKKAAQFVCAGCGNQWYCSRECQVQAWEDHSEMCFG